MNERSEITGDLVKMRWQRIFPHIHLRMYMFTPYQMKLPFLFLLLVCINASVDVLMIHQHIHGHPVAEARFRNFKAQMKQFNLPYSVVDARKVPRHQYAIALSEDYINMFTRLGSTNYTYGVIAEDDTEFHPNFPQELELTLKAAGDVDILALCSGNLWGRVSGAKEPFGTLVYDDPITDDAKDPTGRIFQRWPQFKTRVVEGHRAIWPGAPVALLVRNRPEVISRFVDYIRAHHTSHSDLNFRNVAWSMGSKAKIAAFPQLCREKELGKVV